MLNVFILERLLLKWRRPINCATSLEQGYVQVASYIATIVVPYIIGIVGSRWSQIYVPIQFKEDNFVCNLHKLIYFVENMCDQFFFQDKFSYGSVLKTWKREVDKH